MCEVLGSNLRTKERTGGRERQKNRGEEWSEGGLKEWRGEEIKWEEGRGSREIFAFMTDFPLSPSTQTIRAVGVGVVPLSFSHSPVHIRAPGL